MSSQGRILIIDGDPLRRRALHRDLLDAGFDVSDAEHAEEALALARIREFDVVLLHKRTQDNGVRTCEALRSSLQRVALLVLADAEEPDQIAEMLEAGADQCLMRPLYMPEFTARLRATLRRTGISANGFEAGITIGEIRLDPAQRVAYRSGVPVRLTPKEFTLLHHLMRHAGLPMSHESLLKAVWGADHIGRVEYLRIFMRQLRTKLNDHLDPHYLLTDSCIGYHFVEASAVPSTGHPVGRAA